MTACRLHLSLECKSLPTSLSSLDLWTNPDKVEPFLATWGGETVGCHMIRVLDSAGSTLVEWGQQQQQQVCGKKMIMRSEGDTWWWNVDVKEALS